MQQKDGFNIVQNCNIDWYLDIYQPQIISLHKKISKSSQQDLFMANNSQEIMEDGR
jgi:hypothetical protein